MADHYLKSIELLDEVEDLRVALRGEYAGPHRAAVVSQLHQDLGRVMKLAAIHADLAVRQELMEISTGLQMRGIR